LIERFGQKKTYLAAKSSVRRKHGQIGKTQKPPSLACPARAITHLIPEVRPLSGQRSALFKNAPGVFSTHLIPEVRPLSGQRSALFKNAPGVFFRAAGRFPILTVFPAC